MRWSIIRLIWLRELRDQLRDRRTMFTIVALPLVLYPLLSLVVLQFALTLLQTPSTVGIVANGTSQDFPVRLPASEESSPLPPVSWLALTPLGGTSVDRVLGTAVLAQVSHDSWDYVPLLQGEAVHPLFAQQQSSRPPLFPGNIPLRFQFLHKPASEALAQGEVDLVIAAPSDFLEQVAHGEQATLAIQGREGDDRSRIAREQLNIVLGRWKQHLLDVRLRREGLPNRFPEPFAVQDQYNTRATDELAAATLLDLLVRTFPFLLVMWSLAGALHPAVDLCAGEKERGTMETLLISPAAREEIVLGKFLTIWVFSAGTASMHLLSMAFATWQLRSMLPQGALTLPALFWCLLLVLPLAAFFSAISLAVGAYARSTKEGQYYLMPMFWLTMPLIFLTLAPGVELNQFYSMVPVTGVALLMRQLMLAPTLDAVPWFYFLPVFATVILYSWIALRWAVQQFQREEVLFREAERLDIALWLRRLFRDKEALPTPGQALFCFVVLCGLRWLSLDVGGHWPLLVRNSIVLLAFVAAPPLFMALLLTRRPRPSLNLALPPTGYVFAALLLLPLAELAHYLMTQFPSALVLLHDRSAFVHDAYEHFGAESLGSYWLHFYLVLGLLPAICKEIAFRGFILNGLRSRLADGTAILLSSFLFAVFHMNVFALLPTFLLGVAAGVLAVRSGSLLPGIILHAGCNILLQGGPLASLSAPDSQPLPPETVLPLLLPLALVCTILAAVILGRIHFTAQPLSAATPTP